VQQQKKKKSRYFLSEIAFNIARCSQNCIALPVSEASGSVFFAGVLRLFILLFCAGKRKLLL
jgi:hypothetical protein